jgi:anti-sigma factor RsiW
VTCRELTAFIDGFLDGELPADQQQAFEQHLSLCVTCARYLDSYRISIALGKGAFDDRKAPIPDDVPAELVDGILRARRVPEAD